MGTDDPAPTVAALVARGDYVEAALRAAAAGDARHAIALYERVLRFADALPLALDLPDRPLAVRLALDAGLPGRAIDIAAEIVDADATALMRAAEAFAARGHRHEAAALFERAGEPARAAPLYEKASALFEAGRAYQSAGNLPEALRLYQAQANAAGGAMAAGGDTAVAEAQLARGRLLSQMGRHLDATRALQAAARHPATVTAAQQRLCGELLALGLPYAADEIASRLVRAHPDWPRDPSLVARMTAAMSTSGPVATTPASGATAPPDIPQRFMVKRLLGAGALGRVYLAEDRLLGRPVAIKVLSVGAAASETGRQMFQRFVREAEIARQLRHPNIVELFDAFPDSGLFVMEHLPGGTLGEAILQRGRLPPSSVRRLALDVLTALAAAHRAGVVHRDIKPANIFFDAVGNAKLADFGAAHLLDFGQTQTAGFVGTLGYLSPEQISGAPLSPAADFYALGVTLFQALTGRLPFPGPDFVAQHLSETPPRPGGLVPDLAPVHDEFIARALVKDPAGRFSSAEAMAEALASWPTHDPRPSPAAVAATAASAAVAPTAEVTAATAATIPREWLGDTAAGQLFGVIDQRVGRKILVEVRATPLTDHERQRLQRLAAAGGPMVERVLGIADDGLSVTYEALDGEPVPLAALAPAEARRLDNVWPVLAAAGIAPTPDLPVARTPGGPVVLVAPAITSPR